MISLKIVKELHYAKFLFIPLAVYLVSLPLVKRDVKMI